MAPIKVLIIDDDLDFRESIAFYFLDAGYTVFEGENGREGLEVFQRECPDIVITDLRMPVMDGFEFIPALNSLSPDTPVIVISGAGQIKEAIEAMRLGARDYLVKPILEMDELKLVVVRALRESSLLNEIILLKGKLLDGRLRHPEAFSALITQNVKMIAVLQYLEAIAPTPQPVLITGATGTGKELLAQALHKISLNKGSFVAVNVAGLDDHMFADALFGHAKGAFSGADSSRDGLFIKAAGGTIFLDEIGELSLESQIKLLRVIQEGEFYPLGSDTPKRTDARIVAATNRDLLDMVKAGSFRADLYYRLFAHQIKIPPLCERNDDIPLLLEHFLAEAAGTFGKKKPTPPPELCSYLQAYRFPGNVRQLRGMVFDAVMRHTKGVLSLNSFRKIIVKDRAVIEPVQPSFERSIVFREGDSERMPTLHEAEAVLIEQALQLARGNQGLASTYLGISRNALNKKLIRRRT